MLVPQSAAVGRDHCADSSVHSVLAVTESFRIRECEVHNTYNCMS
jgi:hypothetical protein